MNKLPILTIILITLAMLAACAQPAAVAPVESPEDVTAVEEEIVPEPTIGTPDACLNALYPVRAHAYWRYTAQNANIGSYEITHTINEVSEDGFSLDIQYSTGVSVRNNWTCSDGDLLQMDAPGGPSGSLVSSETFADFVSEENTGITLPGILNDGDAWEQDMRISSEVSLPDGMTGSGEGWYNTSYQAMGRETITVPAGTFDALVIMVYTVYDLTMSVEGTEVAVPVEMMGMLWYAEGVGLIRSEITSTMGGSETIELTSYFIP